MNTFNTIDELIEWYDNNVVTGKSENLLGQFVGGELFEECVKNAESMRKRFEFTEIGFGEMEEWYMGEGEGFTINENGEIIESFEYF